jgi:hypothetical protein
MLMDRHHGHGAGAEREGQRRKNKNFLHDNLLKGAVQQLEVSQATACCGWTVTIAVVPATRAKAARIMIFFMVLPILSV